MLNSFTLCYYCCYFSCMLSVLPINNGSETACYASEISLLSSFTLFVVNVVVVVVTAFGEANGEAKIRDD